MQIEKVFYNQFLKRWNEGYFKDCKIGSSFIQYALMYSKLEAENWPVSQISDIKEFKQTIKKNFQLV